MDLSYHESPLNKELHSQLSVSYKKQRRSLIRKTIDPIIEEAQLSNIIYHRCVRFLDMFSLNIHDNEEVNWINITCACISIILKYREDLTTHSSTISKFCTDKNLNTLHETERWVMSILSRSCDLSFVTPLDCVYEFLFFLDGVYRYPDLVDLPIPKQFNDACIHVINEYGVLSYKDIENILYNSNILTSLQLLVNCFIGSLHSTKFKPTHIAEASLRLCSLSVTVIQMMLWFFNNRFEKVEKCMEFLVNSFSQ